MLELVYVDYERLQSYAQQSGRRSRRMPSYSGAIGLAGPSVGVTLTRPELSKVHEQLDAVHKYLTREKLLGYERQFPTQQLFCEETLELQSVYLPPSDNDPLLKNGLSIWISDPPDHHNSKPGLLLLIEQFPLPDEPSVKNFTGYTLLAMLEGGALGFKYSEVPGVGADTRLAFKKFGARMGPAKMATVLYRVRATFMEQERDYSVTTIGYPIAIWRA